MPTATLAFNLPEEKEDFELATSAGRMHCALHELAVELRRLAKYSETNPGSWSEVRDLFYRILNENNVEV